MSFLNSPHLPKCLSDLFYHCSYQPECDWGSRVSGFVVLVSPGVVSFRIINVKHLEKEGRSVLFFVRFIFSCEHATRKEALFVGLLVRWSVGLLVLVKDALMNELKSAKTSFYGAAVMIVCVSELGGMDWGRIPLPTRPRRYFDPASLVSSI